MNAIQKAYVLALANYEAVEHIIDEQEEEYCHEHGYLTEEGKPAKHIWMIEDEEVFDKANADFSALHPEYDEQRNTARETLVSATDNMIDWALSIIPNSYEKEREKLRKGVKEEYKKIIVAHIIGLQNEIGYANFPQYQILQKLLKIIKED